MNVEERNQALLKADGLFHQARKIERRIKWNNDAERDSLIGKRDSILFEALWNYNKAIYGRKGV